MSRLLMAGCLALSLAGCAKETTDTTEKEEMADATLACSEESACDVADQADVNMEEVDFGQIIEYFKDGKSFVVYFGFPDCPWCRESVPVLEEALDEVRVDVPVYYVRTRDDEYERLYDDGQKEEIIPYIGGYMSDNEDGELTLYVPLVVKVVDGQVVSGHVGTVDGHDAKEREMSDQEKSELLRTYKDLLETA